MHWYSTLKSILFGSSKNLTAPRHRHDVPKLSSLPQPALVGGTLAGSTLDRRAIRLRRD